MHPPADNKGDLMGSPMCPPPPLVDPLSLEALDNDNNQLATGVSKAGGGWKESIDDHSTTMAGADKQQERVVDNDGSNKEGKGAKGDGDGNECGR
jgi:hypothetical protein